MSTPAIYIELQGTTSHVTPRYTRLMCPPREAHVRPADSQPHGAVFQISHTPYGIRNSEFWNRKPGCRKSSWCGIFPLDHLIMVR